MMMKMTQRTIRSDYDDDHDSDFFKWFILDLLQQIFNILKKKMTMMFMLQGSPPLKFFGKNWYLSQGGWET